MIVSGIKSQQRPFVAGRQASQLTRVHMQILLASRTENYQHTSSSIK